MSHDFNRVWINPIKTSVDCKILLRAIIFQSLYLTNVLTFAQVN